MKKHNRLLKWRIVQKWELELENNHTAIFVGKKTDHYKWFFSHKDPNFSPMAI